MQSLFDNIVRDFAERDKSLDKIVSRSARRLVEKGASVPSIKLVGKKIETFTWGEASTAQRAHHVWQIDVLFYENQKLVHAGSVQVRQRIEKHFARCAADRATKPKDVASHMFVPDCDMTYRKLREDSEADPLKRVKKGGPLLLLDRIARISGKPRRKFVRK